MLGALRLLGCLWLYAATSVWSGDARATFHLFVVEQIYSNADGRVQFIVFRQTPPSGGEHEWKGQWLDSIHDGITDRYTFPRNLPSSSTANRYVLVATQGFADLGIVTPDYVIPNGFLVITQGRVGCCDGYEVAYAALPTDGVTAIDAFGFTLPNVATNFAGQSGSVTAAQAAVSAATIVEYYNLSLDHYFITWIANEIALLDAGTQIKGWSRTGYMFGTYPTAQAGTNPVCRYYIPPAKGDSHFFGRGTVECNATGQKNPSFILEDPSFMHMFLPVAGVCAATTTPIYRVFSNRPDANHRYMTDKTVRNQMVAKGWLAEGDGPDLVVMCAPK